MPNKLLETTVQQGQKAKFERDGAIHYEVKLAKKTQQQRLKLNLVLPFMKISDHFGHVTHFLGSQERFVLCIQKMYSLLGLKHQEHHKLAMTLKNCIHNPTGDPPLSIRTSFS